MDPTDLIIAPEDWEPHGVICRKALDESRGQESICGCQVCERQRKEGNEGN